MSPSVADANESLRKAVAARRDAQAEGKPLDEWYGSQDETNAFHGVTEPMPERKTAEDLQQNDDRLRGDGLTQTDVHPTSQRFLDLLEEMRTLHISKSSDYGSITDPLANIRQGAEFVNIEPWRGCMVRIADKVQRLRTFCQTGRLVHEGVRDTLLDLSAYSLLAIVLFDEGAK